ncbi:hypothetical protein [Coraliomargarita akajimensis]|uniref:Lipocalin-like domain-containing protein n=1 Tax=Coraliomargarita akajimensis (strain DSM 45221 / IAM 15411 / JCM 23193 / KCTC 12865 / 04OKA010-24) TaxID=583355 RepID=D5EKP4_CORAD|nr:hypothetical protein [Coraliomargarita akajimensis]ADE54951.1 hypothetical protein Caka_1933 [Coraliomargarita akajimensis DSM 45221]
MKLLQIVSLICMLSSCAEGVPSVIGTWKSNQLLTLQHSPLDSSVDETTRSKFENLFGRMTITYSRTQATSRMDADEGIEAWESVSEYRILIQTKDKLLIEWLDRRKGEWKKETLHFVNPDRYWIMLELPDGTVLGREYFDRQS